MKISRRFRNTTLAIAGLALAALAGPQAADRVVNAPVDSSGMALSEDLRLTELWKAVAASGKVEARGADMTLDEWQRVSRGDTVKARSHVRTFKRSRATLTRSGDVILVDAESQVLLPGVGAHQGSRIRQESGSILYQIESRANDRVEVLTPYLVAGVKGTVFGVIVGDQFASVSVVEGHVEVRSLATGETVDLFAGDMTVLEEPKGRLEVFREGRRESALSGEDRPSRSAKRSLRETRRLIERGANDDMFSPIAESSLWMVFERDDWFKEQDGSLTRRDRLDAMMEEDRQDLRNEDDRSTSPKTGTKTPAGRN